MRCRICNAHDSRDIGVIKPYVDYSTSVYDCSQCGCRFVERDASVYEKLHDTISSYSRHRELAKKAEWFFKNNKIKELREYLCRIPKNRYVIDQIESDPSFNRILEVGCSRGFLSSYFILKGYSVTATDISPTAIEAASSSFGDHFCLSGEKRIEEGAPYDAIYHVGTIGCVEDPIAEIKRQLNMLRPGGILVFNAPNVDYCKFTGEKWVTSTSPPDLVTLFAPQFWSKNFYQLAEVRTDVQNQMFMDYFALRMLKKRQKSSPPSLFGVNAKPARRRSAFYSGMSRAIAGMSVNLLNSLLPSCFGPSEFGVFVRMQKL